MSRMTIPGNTAVFNDKILDIFLGPTGAAQDFIVHVSGREAIYQIAWARNRGLKIYAETCPQYLFLAENDLDKPGIEGARCMCSPPPRDKANQEFVWRGLETGVFDVFSSDHAPYRMDTSGKLHAGPNPPFKKIDVRP